MNHQIAMMSHVYQATNISLAISSNIFQKTEINKNHIRDNDLNFCQTCHWLRQILVLFLLGYLSKERLLINKFLQEIHSLTIQYLSYQNVLVTDTVTGFSSVTVALWLSKINVHLESFFTVKTKSYFLTEG